MQSPASFHLFVNAPDGSKVDIRVSDPSPAILDLLSKVAVRTDHVPASLFIDAITEDE